MLYLNYFKHFLYAGRKFKGNLVVMEMIYPPGLYAFVDKTTFKELQTFQL